MLEIFISCVLSTIILLVYGNLFCSYFFKLNIYKTSNFSENSIFGIIFLSFFALIINFLIPIEKSIGTIMIIISLVLFIIFSLRTKYKKELVSYIFYTSVITFFLLCLSNVNRPDAGLYHLPYTSLINENKIILGSTNIHFRFGHISSVQYLSSIYNNYLFSSSIITVPLASIVSIFLVYLTKEFYSFFNKKKEIAFIIFLILLFSIFNFNRYSSFGNDVPSHVYFFIIIIYFLKINSLKKCDLNTFFKIFILTIFLITLKLFMIVVIIIPFIMFLLSKYKKKIILNKNLIIFSIFGLLWVLKNLLTSGCLFYPIQKTCFKNLDYFNQKQTEQVVNASEAWSKGWSDQKEIILSYDEYNKNLNWLKTWSNEHLKKIFEKITPFAFFLIFLILSIYFKKFFKSKNYKFNSINKKRLLELFVINLLFFSVWFFKFPLYRYGLSFIGLTLIIIIFLLVSRNITLLNKKFFSTFIIIGFLALFLKNGIRIYEKLNIEYDNYPWPRIYSMSESDNNIEKKFTKITDDKNNFIFYYSQGQECMYSKSPCSNYKNKNLKIKKIYNYLIYYF